MKYFILNNQSYKIEDWKRTNQQYLLELQKFLDKASNIQDKTLQYDVIIQMLKCDEILTKESENMFYHYYINGYHDAMNKNME